MPGRTYTEARKRGILKYQEKKERVVLWLDPAQKRKIEELADVRGQSVNKTIAQLLTDVLRQCEEEYPGAPDEIITIEETKTMYEAFRLRMTAYAEAVSSLKEGAENNS